MRRQRAAKIVSTLGPASSTRERIRALSDGHGVLETRVEGGRYVAAITLPAPAAG